MPLELHCLSLMVEKNRRGGVYDGWKLFPSQAANVIHLHGGAVGRNLVDLLSQEVTLWGRGMMKAERLIVFLRILLQRSEMVRKGLI